MIGYFPEPHRDELLFSVIARYADHLQFPTHRPLLRVLFASNRVSTLVDLPRLDPLLSLMPPGVTLAADEIIDTLTLLPLFSPFLSKRRVAKIRKAIKGEEAGTIHLLVGLSGCRVPNPRWFRYCPVCKEEDEERVGETWWRRLHQVPGVEVCPVHRVFLENGLAPRLCRQTARAFGSARVATPEKKPRPIDASNASHWLLLRLAENVAWLLQNPQLTIDPSRIRNTYLDLLRDRDFTTCNRRPYRARILSAFSAMYPGKYLQRLGSSLHAGGDIPWLFRLLHNHADVFPVNFCSLLILGVVIVSSFVQTRPVRRPARL